MDDADYSHLLGDMMVDDDMYPIDADFMDQDYLDHLEGLDPDMFDPELLEQYYGDDDEVYQYMRGMQDYLRAEEQQPVYARISVDELIDQCILPTLSQAVNTVIPLLLLCLVNRLSLNFMGVLDKEREKKDDDKSSTQTSTDLSTAWLHMTSCVCGLVAAHLFFQASIIYPICLAVLSYSVIYTVPRIRPGTCGPILAGTTVIYLVSCECFGVDPVLWHQIRGAQMILAMKAVSVGFDLDSKQIPHPPNVTGFLGYVFHPGSVIFGPWVSYMDYADHRFHKNKKLSFWWFYKLLKSLCLALCFVVLSTCVVHWIILTNYGRWLSAYRDAQSFRFSSYFVGFLAELTLVMSGLGATRKNGDVKWDASVSRPLHVELPRSLVEVVTNWNLPMHHWLRTYVFKTARPLGNFMAIILTYFASSILHGLNFQLAAVLLSLGFYSYTEYMFRRRLAVIFDACIKAKRCREDCNHTYTAMHPVVVLVNLSFGFLTMFHLAYLGLMFDSSEEQDTGYTMTHTLQKWSGLDYLSHQVAIGMFVLYKLI